MTITKKVAMLLALALAGILMLAGIAQYQMGRVFESANYDNVNAVPSLQSIGVVSTTFGNFRVLSWQHVASDDKAVMAELDQKMAANQQKLEETLASHEIDHGEFTEF
ncbi:MAG TPA: MCP four helix bundle domain-containing protein [Rhodocyclaceae bacterium]|nr:MCP four helix bundle domain-containing protein [Rhodocyclaceae bacterium]